MNIVYMQIFSSWSTDMYVDAFEYKYNTSYIYTIAMSNFDCIIHEYLATKLRKLWDNEQSIQEMAII